MILEENFLNRYRDKAPKFGYGDLGEFVMLEKYSHLINGEKETWFDIVRRNVEGIFWIYDNYKRNNYYDSEKKQIAEDMFDAMFNMEFLPAGRPLSNLGTSIIQDRKIATVLYNCAFIDFGDNTSIMDKFRFILDMSMLGVGVGVNVNPNINHYLHRPDPKSVIHKVDDSREGWLDALTMLIGSYLYSDRYSVAFDYSQIRSKGSPIRGMGGIHPGFEPFEEMLESIRAVLNNNKYITVRVVSDIANIIGRCVISGGQRRTALLLLGNDTDTEFINLKNYEINPERQSIGYTSNNSIFGSDYTDYDKLVEDIDKGLDIGIVWLDNAKRYGRMNGILDLTDMDVSGFNPCVEIQLESYEVCNLVEINPNNIRLHNMKKVLKSAMFFAKIMSLMPVHLDKTNQIIEKNRRIGIGQTGITQYVEKIGIDLYKRLLDEWYNEVKKINIELSKNLGINKSVRTTTVKPSGSISKLMGVSAGIHYNVSRYVLRRVRVSADSSYVEYYRNKGYHIEPDVYSPNTMVITFPLDYGTENTVENKNVEDQIKLAKVMQEYWSDNAVSITVSVKDDDIDELSHWIKYGKDNLKCLSFLKTADVLNLYKQVPEEPITKKQYEEELRKIQPKVISINLNLPDITEDKYCTSSKCETDIFLNNVSHK